MPDGQSAVTLRRMGTQWSLKFGFFSRVVNLGELSNAQILQVNTVGDATNIVLQTSSPDCARQYKLVSLGKNSSASVWDIKMPCADTVPLVQTGQFEQYIDFVVGSRVSRFIYRAGKLVRQSDVILPPGATSLPGPSGTEGSAGAASQDRYRPGPPFAPTPEQLRQRPDGSAPPPPAAEERSSRTGRSAPAPAAKAPARSTPRPAQPASTGTTTPAAIHFGAAGEVKPTIVIDLTK